MGFSKAAVKVKAEAKIQTEAEAKAAAEKAAAEQAAAEKAVSDVKVLILSVLVRAIKIGAFPEIESIGRDTIFIQVRASLSEKQTQLLGESRLEALPYHMQHKTQDKIIARDLT